MVVSLRSALCALTLLLGLLVQATPAADVEFEHSFWAYADSILSDNAFQGASWSVQISSVTSGSVIYEKDPDRLVTPASVAKVLTSSAAMATLGPDYRFATTCLTSGDAVERGAAERRLDPAGGGRPDAGSEARVDPTLVGGQPEGAGAAAHVGGNLVLSAWPFRSKAPRRRGAWTTSTPGSRPRWTVSVTIPTSATSKVLPGSYDGDNAQYVLDPPFAPVHIRSRVVTAPKGQPAELRCRWHRRTRR